MWKKCSFLAAVVLMAGLADVARPNLVGYWKFDEGSGGTAVDSSGNGLDGTLNGNPQWVEGQLGGALDFNGSADFVEIPHHPLLSITEEITIAAWTNMSATASGEMAIVSKGGWAANNLPYELTETPGDVIFWQFYDDAGRDTCSPDSPPVDEWHHIAATYDGSIFKCYIDGELAEEWEYAGTMPENTASVTIGRRSTGGTFFNGMIDDVAIYDRALDEGEIQSIMEGHLREEASAHSPNPRDGAMLDLTRANLTWQSGTFAALHDVYFAESSDAVAAATPDDADLFVGRQATEILPVGVAGGPRPEGLVPGQSYYWRVDEVNDTEPNSPWKGTVWSFSVRPLTAWGPFPVEGMKYVDLNQDLTWQPGMDILFHTVFFGESFEEVNGAVAGGWMMIGPPYDPGPMELDKTYYWRVDEFAGMTTHKGQVWSFTTRGQGGGVKAEYFDGIDVSGDPILTRVEGSIDHNWGEAEVAAGLADNVSARWTANLEAPFTEAYRLITTSDDGVRLWLDGRPVINNWTDHGTEDNTARADLVAGQYYLIQMEWYESGGGAVAQLSWESPTLPRQIIPQGWLQLPLRAVSPSPAHLEPHAPQTTMLSWIAGGDATQHEVYFGQDGGAVADADATTAGIYRGQQPADSVTFDPGPLEWGKTYYWRVDEVNPDEVLKGAVWSFTAADFLLVEDFESYDDDIDGGTAIFQTWIDGVENGTASYVGYEVAGDGTFGERQIVHGGDQSMPLEYNNANAPYYSEAECSFAASLNLTVNGMDTLTLFVRGQGANDPASLYVGLEDTAGRVGVVSYPSETAVTSSTWIKWDVPLADFTGVNAAAVKKMYIGVGDRSAPTPGGAGLIFIDDIRATKPAPGQD